MKVYLDNGATTRVADSVQQAVGRYGAESYGNASSLHSFGRQARQAIERSRASIARSIGAEPSEIIFTSGGTESNNLALKGIAFEARRRKDKRDQILISAVEHDCVMSAAGWLEKEGFQIISLPVDTHGIVQPSVLKEAITDRTLIGSIMHANNEIGTILPIGEYGKICRESAVLFHTDACQSYTKVPIDVRNMQIDLMTLNAHKIHGPKGVGALFIRKGVKISPLSHGGGHEFSLRSGTENVPGIVGFAEAAALHSIEEIARMEALRDKLISALLRIPDTHLNGHPTERLCNNASISFHFIEGESLLMQLDMQGIAVSTGSACSSKSLEASHVLLAIGLPHEIAHGTIRFSLSRYTTEEEIDYTIEKVIEAVARLRAMSPLKEGVVYEKGR